MVEFPGVEWKYVSRLYEHGHALVTGRDASRETLDQEDLTNYSTRLRPMSGPRLDVDIDPLHVFHVALRVPDLLDEVGITGLRPPLNEGLQGLLVLVPLLEFLVRRAFLDLGRGGVPAGTLARLGQGLLTRGAFRGVLLPLAALARAAAGRGRRRRRGRCPRDAVVVVDAPHVVPEVPLPGESTSRSGALASLVGAEEGLVAVAVHGVGLALMAEEARGGGKPGVLAGVDLASVGLQVGIHEFAAAPCVVVSWRTMGSVWYSRAQILTHSCT